MAESKKIYTDKGYYAQHEGNTSEIPSNFKGLGYYSRTSVEDIVNNFIIAYIGEDKAINKVPKYEVEFWAQRGVQEFSYDVLQSDKAIEIELGAALQFPLPQDYVNYTKITVTNTDGNQIALLPAQNVSNPTAFLQGSNHEFLYDNQGKVQLAEDSTTITRFQTADRDQVTANDYYSQDYNQENFSYYNNRFGSNPGSMNKSGTFFIDSAKGIIYFDSSLAGNSDNIITLHYISDGLVDNGDLSKVYVPKLAEDALYAYIIYNLSKVRPQAAQVVGLYKKEASSKMRNTKIRLTNYRSEEIAQVLRGKSKWIKH
jgi:hypothetical protein